MTRAALTLSCIALAALWALWALCTGFASALSAQGPPSAPVRPDDTEIRRLLVQRIDVERRNIAIVVGIVTPAGRRVVSYGRVSRGEAREPTGDTVFEIGSVTKVFTSALLADMVRRGEVGVTDSVFKYLPAEATPTPGNGRTITLADLATHTSALPFWPSNVPATREGALSMARYSEAQLLTYLSSFDIPDGVGQKWVYSNVDAGVLGLALGRRAGLSYEALLRSRVTAPLQMHSTAVTVSDEMRSRHAVGYDAALEVAPAWDVPVLAGAGSLHSSVNDLLTFLAAFGDEPSPLAGVLPIMLATRRPGPGIPQALGWWILAPGVNADGVLTHDGGTLGFTSSLAYDPKTRTGVAVLSNTARSVGDIARHLLVPAIPLTPPPAATPPKAASEGR